MRTLLLVTAILCSLAIYVVFSSIDTSQIVLMFNQPSFNADYYRELPTEFRIPKLTFGVNLYHIDTKHEYEKTLFCISTWLWASPTGTLLVYGSMDDMGLYGISIIHSLFDRFGRERVHWKGSVNQRYHVLAVPELFDQVQRDSPDDIVAVINSDMILTPEHTNIIGRVNELFGSQSNWSVMFGRKNIPEKSFDLLKNTREPFRVIKEINQKQHNMPAIAGFDIFLWNKAGVRCGSVNYAPFLIGRPHFEYWFVNEMTEQGVFISTYPYNSLLHINHRERMQWSRLYEHPEVLWNVLIKDNNFSFRILYNYEFSTYIRGDRIGFKK